MDDKQTRGPVPWVSLGCVRDDVKWPPVIVGSWDGLWHWVLPQKIIFRDAMEWFKKVLVFGSGVANLLISEICKYSAQKKNDIVAVHEFPNL